MLWLRSVGQARGPLPSELERGELYALLGGTEDKALAQQALKLVFSGEFPPTIGPRIVGRVSQRHPEMALDFTITNWEKLSKMLEGGTALQFVPGMARNSADLKSIEKLNAFAAAHVPENARQDIVLAIARVRYQANMRATRLPEIDRWLSKMGSDPIS